ncbi:carbohydrate ABC transporter permease [Rhizobium oryzihabitans]|jgi:multiple sugar transport system permease protein|uniref:Carbohydrate ABC transporter permease n=1 Tax=Rhizobium oryzihabitans TaxID=2267833 RepID=A0A7L5BNU5_9HYPH|nr:carbohydrate ABC transporter permease [Rhizobium oryzihabitans]EGP55502.1 putative transmembrane component of ABC transporter [Agrobacterium tumefaciens F2]MCW0982606.1 carbohydrate ABC transporter permease [Agrobacterium sp. BT-220-3]QCM07537.1 carbohydrate ABC transporter permease [Agrobacterium tumefaciens]CUX56810.1 putative transmembrane component of ABC transporter [Agrobacterium genomosp. 5 str. CFBP 6626]QIB40528.1 carbohydrate ABC transporter permease [Rhizobium oryzihabitans]
MAERTETAKAAASRYGLLLVISLYCIMPFLWLLAAAFDADATLFLKMPAQFSLTNVFRVFLEQDGLRWLMNSLIVCGLSTVLVLFLAGFGGYALSRTQAWWKRPFLYSIILIRVLPTTALIVPLYKVMLSGNQFIASVVRPVVDPEYFRATMRIVGFIDGYFGLIVLMATMHLPLALWIMKTFFDTVPREYEEAAIMDGATFAQRLRRVLIPLAMPGLAASGLFAFIAAWGDFLLPLTFISSPELRMLPLGIYSAFLRTSEIDYGLLAAIATIYTIPAIIAFAFARRFLVQTFGGGLKG